MKYIIDLHVGHGTSLDGSWDSGCVYDKYTEANLMYKIVKCAIPHLKASGVTVYSDADTGNNKNMTRDVMEANKRYKASKDIKHIYVSVHCDYSKAPSGVLPIYTSAEGKKIATALNKSIKSTMGMKSRGVQKNTTLYELNQTDMPACLLETGAIANDLKILRDKPDLYGEAIAKGICAYYGIKFVSASDERVKGAGAVAEMSMTTVTVSQLKSLQKLLGVSQSGYIGGQDKTKAQYYSGFYKLCKYDGGSGKSTTVKALQKALGVSQSGVLNQTTIKAFQKFLNSKQTTYKLDIDGYFGEQSTKALVVYLSSKPSKITLPKPTKTTKTTSTNINRAKFIKALKEVGDDCISHKFVYSNKNSKSTYSSALKSNKRVNCARYVTWAMQRAGLLPYGKVIWLSKKINGNGASYVKKSAKLKVSYPNKYPKDCKLIAGDICGFDIPHTMVTANTKGTSWFSAGGSDIKAKKIYYRRKAGYDKKRVKVLIRIA